jgi:HD-GYP domain-containing protein (c-di-GMP phosphodiesterase class II)
MAEERGRLAELTIALSLATDLGLGQPMDHGLRTCWLSAAAARELGLDAEDRSCVYFTALLRFLGCTSDATEVAAMAGGDDLAFNAAMAPILMADPAEGMRHFVRHLAEDLPLRQRAGRVVRALADPGYEHRSLAGHCEVASRLAGRLGLPDAVGGALSLAYERWDGRGQPGGLAGDEVPLAIRIVAVARDVEMWSRHGGWPAAVEVLRARRGRAHDPEVVDAFLGSGDLWLGELGDDPGSAVLAVEPEPMRTIAGGAIDRALTAVGDFADLKSPYFRSHSGGVARLAAGAAEAAGLVPPDAVLTGRAALVHDVGRVGVAAGIWNRDGPLTSSQWEKVRLHAYLGERVLRRSELTSRLAIVAAAHHERADGSGYPRGVVDDELSVPARLLAAADEYHAMTEARPHRPALSTAEAAERLQEDADQRRFGRRVVEAVLEAAGETSRPANVQRPAGLTEREVDVLRLIARGNANKAVARVLGISTKTVGHHVEHIYAKAGVTTRSGATLFAMEHDLL